MGCSKVINLTPLIGQITFTTGIICEYLLFHKPYKIYISYWIMITGMIISSLFYLSQTIIYSTIRINDSTSNDPILQNNNELIAIFKRKRLRAIILSISSAILLAGSIVISFTGYDLRAVGRPCLYFKLTFLIGYVVGCCTWMTPRKSGGNITHKMLLIFEVSDVAVLLVNFLLGGFFIVYVFCQTSNGTFMFWIILEVIKTLAFGVNLTILLIFNL
jgi:hypothetical protein